MTHPLSEGRVWPAVVGSSGFPISFGAGARGALGCVEPRTVSQGCTRAMIRGPVGPSGECYFPILSSTFFVMRVTCGSLPRSPNAQSVVPTVTTVPPRV